MSKVYYVKFKDELIGIINYPECTFIKAKTWDKTLPYSLAHYGTPKDYKPSKEEVMHFLKDRVIDENNDSITEVMESIGYPFYDLEVLLDCTCGMKTEDFYWTLPEDRKDWKYEDKHIRVHPELYIYSADTKEES